MEKRKLEIENLSCYTRTIENEVTLILQNLQWDPKQFIKDTSMTVCKYDKNHKIPPDSKKTHEEECYLKCEDYAKEDLLFPEPLDCNSSSLVKLSADKISEITNNAAKVDALFKKVFGVLYGCKMFPKIVSFIKASYYLLLPIFVKVIF